MDEGLQRLQYMGFDVRPRRGGGLAPWEKDGGDLGKGWEEVRMRF